METRVAMDRAAAAEADAEAAAKAAAKAKAAAEAQEEAKRAAAEAEAEEAALRHAPTAAKGFRRVEIEVPACKHANFLRGQRLLPTTAQSLESILNH